MGYDNMGYETLHNCCATETWVRNNIPGHEKNIYDNIYDT